MIRAPMRAAVSQINRLLGGWLHRVAYRVALQASADAALRRGRERSVADLLVEDRTQEPRDKEAYRVLHEEVACLSEKYRLPVLLCDLEGKTHTQAALELNCGETTIQRRRARAHELLRSRLARRGISLTATALIAAMNRSADACVPTTCMTATIKAATQMTTSAMRIAIGEVVSTTAAALVRKSLRGMLIGELRTITSSALILSALSCIAWGFVLPGQADGRPGGAMAKNTHNARLAPGPTKSRQAE